MPTVNPRINVTFEQEVSSQISSLAAQEHKSASRLVKELVIEALERREDVYFSELAESRDVENSKKISHKNAWK